MRNLLSLLCNLIVIFATFPFVYQMVFRNGQNRWDTFRYFTTDSNVLAAIAALLIFPYNIIALSSGVLSIPAWVVICKYMGTVAVTVTFITVMLFLGPTQGYGVMLAGGGLYMHLIGPVLSIASFCLFETGTLISQAQTLWGLLPMFLYGTLYLVMVVQKGVWKDFYGFNRRGMWPVSYVVMHAVTYGVCVALRLLQGYCARL